MKTLQENLEFWMKKRGFGQKGLALEAGLNETFVRDVLEGKSKNPKFDSIIKLCQALQIFPHELIEDIKSFYPEDMQELMDDISRTREKQNELRAKAIPRDKPTETH